MISATRSINHKIDDKTSNELPVILYMSITGNPAHLGHMACVAAAIDSLKERHLKIDKVFISLSDQPYYYSKVSSDVKTGKKIALDQAERVSMLEEVIALARENEMFDDATDVVCWDDQDHGFSDHPHSYIRLAQEHEGTHEVYLVGGVDLCDRSMGNWMGRYAMPSSNTWNVEKRKSGFVKNAVIVERDGGESIYKKAQIDPTLKRIYVKSAKYQNLAEISSSKIQEWALKIARGKATLLDMKNANVSIGSVTLDQKFIDCTKRKLAL